MTEDDIDRKLREQNEWLWKNVNYLDTLDPKKRNAHVLLRVVCGECSGVIVEVLRTFPYLALLYRTVRPSEEESIAHRELRRAWFDAGMPKESFPEGPPQVRQQGLRHLHLLEASPAEGVRVRGFLRTACNCRQHKLTLDNVHAWLRRGDPKVVLGSGTLR